MRAAVDRRLVDLVPGTASGIVAEASAAAVTSPGKRLRAALVFLVAEAAGRDRATLVDVGCVVEIVHAASLVLDDLPCMDDAVLRRGEPTLHRRYGEAVAILAAFSLLATAQSHLAPALAAAGVPPAHREQLSGRLAEVVRTLCRGQAADLALSGRADLEELERIHAEKTGALFELAAELGSIGGGVDTATRAAILAYARNLGLAFQVSDDILDATGSASTLGKDAGRDRDLGRTTFVRVFGLEGATTLRDELLDTAVAALRPLGGRAAYLELLAEHVRTRSA